MLQMRPNCECCDRELPADVAGAMICSFECTFCVSCVETVLHGRCPNCGGAFGPRPLRAAELLGMQRTRLLRRMEALGMGEEPPHEPTATSEGG